MPVVANLKRRTRVERFGVVAILAVLLFGTARAFQQAWLAEDLFITLRYCDQLLAGNGRSTTSESAPRATRTCGSCCTRSGGRSVSPPQHLGILYYGDLLPNTFYAKSGDSSYWSQGLLYLRTYVQVYPGLLLALPAFVIAVASFWRARGRNDVAVLVAGVMVSPVSPG